MAEIRPEPRSLNSEFTAFPFIADYFICSKTFPDPQLYVYGKVKKETSPKNIWSEWNREVDGGLQKR